MDETGKVKFEKQGRKLMLVMKKISLNDASEYSCNAGEGPTASKTIGGIEVQGQPTFVIRDSYVFKKLRHGDPIQHFFYICMVY